MANYLDYLPDYAPPSTGDWKRPFDWLALPTVTSAEQKFVGLHAVFPNGNNFCALLVTTSAGQYEVDWGDGTTTLYNSNTKAEYQYDYSTISASTDCTRGYRQVLVTVTPVSGNITSFNSDQRYTGLARAYATGWLDIIASFPNASGGGRNVTIGGGSVFQSMMEQITLLTIGGSTSCANIFDNCYSLQSVPLFDTASVTNMASMFGSCASLEVVPLFNTASVQAMNSMFTTCASLRTVPLFNTASVTTMAISKSPAVRNATPKLPLILIVALVVAERSTKLLNISTMAVRENAAFSKLTVRANTISQRDRLLASGLKLSKLLPAVVVMAFVGSAGMLCTEYAF